jgi:hypothetical protein
VVELLDRLAEEGVLPRDKVGNLLESVASDLDAARQSSGNNEEAAASIRQNLLRHLKP